MCFNSAGNNSSCCLKQGNLRKWQKKSDAKASFKIRDSEAVEKVPLSLISPVFVLIILN